MFDQKELMCNMSFLNICRAADIKFGYEISYE